MAIVETVGRGGKTFQKSLMFVGKTVGIAILLWLFVMILASTLQILVGIDFVTIEYVKVTRWTVWNYCCQTVFEGTFLEYTICGNYCPEFHETSTIATLDVDVATFIIVGAIDLILQVLHTLALVIGMVIVWLINFFIFGEDSSGYQLNPIALFQILKVIPFIKEVVAGVHGIDESIITSLDVFLTAIDDLFYEIANGFFTGIAGVYENIAREVLGKRK